MPKIVITMPAYQAEDTLERTVLAIPEGIADELILVDDASRDGTADLARGLGLTVHVHPTNRGYGGNQKSCYRLAIEAGADIVVMLHPDYQYEPKAVPLLIAPILAGDADMTFGSRFAGMGDPLAGGMPFYRYVGNRITTVAQNLLLGTRFTDMHSGMRAYTRRALESLPFLGYPDGFSFDAELLVDAVTSGLRVVEVPIPTRYSLESSSISVGRSLEYVVHGTGFAGRQAVARGRRGRRYLPAWRRGRPSPIARGPITAEACRTCGNERTRLLSKATSDVVPTDAFACTTSGLGEHDDIVECTRCGMISALSSLTSGEIADAYRDAVDERYFDEEPARRETFEWILDRIAAFTRSGDRLFEVGAHAGLLLDAATARGWMASGIDPSTWAVATGVARYGADLSVGRVEEVDLPPASVDALVLLDVLEHLTEPWAVLRRLRPAVEDRGVLALTTVNVDGLHRRARGQRWPWFTTSHLHYFRPQTLVPLLADAGFEVVAWDVVPRRFHLSYVADRAEGVVPGASVARRAAAVVDPRVPVGWMGDVALLIARPA